MAQPGKHLSDQDLSFIIGSVKYGDSLGHSRTDTYKSLAAKLDRDWKTIAGAVNRLMPTVDLAKMRLRAGASRMARRIINRGSTSELIDVLSRPNIGVLDPIKSEKGQGGGFFMSVEMDSLGAVRIGAAQSALPQPSQPLLDVGEAPSAPPDEAYIVMSNQNEAERPPAPKPESMFEKKLRESRERLAAARENPLSAVAIQEKAEGFKLKRKRFKKDKV